MANDFDAYDPIFYAQEALELLENALGMAGRIHRGYDRERTSVTKGSTIQINQPSTLTTQAGGTGTTNDLTTKKIDLVMDDWREVKFAVTDKELAYSGEQIINIHIKPAVYALANYIETKLTDLYKSVPWSYDVGATPAASDIINCRKVLRDNAGAILDYSTGDVHFAIDSTLEAAFLGLNLFHEAATTGQGNNTEALMYGSLGTRFGVEHFVQQTLATHTSGTVISGENDVAGALTADASAGDTSIAVDGLNASETIVAGDSFVIAGNSQRYVATATTTLTTGAGTISCYPALVTDYSNNDVVTFETIGSTNYADKYFSNLMFHKDAFAIALAPLPEIGDGIGAHMATITDPRTGLSIRSRLAYIDASATVNVTLDILFGYKCIQPNMAVVARRNYA